MQEWQTNQLAHLRAKVEALRTEVGKYPHPSKKLLANLKNAELDAGLAEGRFKEPTNV